MVATYWGNVRLFSRDAWVAIAIWMVIGLCLDGIFSVLLNLYLLRLGYDAQFVGLANGVSLAVGALWSPLAGAAGSRWGLRQALLAGMIVYAGGLTLVSLAELLAPAGRGGWVLATLSLTSVGITLLFVNIGPFMMSVTEPAERTHVFSVSQALRPLAALLGSLLGGMLPGFLAAAQGVSLDQAMPYRWSLLCAPLLSIPVILATLATHVAPDRSPQGGRIAGEAGPWTLVALLTTVYVLIYVGMGATMFLNVYLDAGLHTPTSLIGLLKGLGSLVSVPMALALPFLAGRYGLFRVVAGGIAGMVLGVLLIVLIPHWAMAGAGSIVWSSFYALCTAAFSIYSQELVAPRWRPTMSGITSMFISLGMAGAAYGGGYVIEGLGYPALCLLGAAASASALGVFWGYFRRPRGELARAGQARG